MAAKELFDADDEQNLDAYDDLIVSIQAKESGLSLLIAVCDDANFRDEIIAKYEAELQSKFRLYRVTLARGEPSLKAAIYQLVQSEEYLRQGGKAVITVTGAEQLYFLRMGEERSEQEIFFGYLQWTREAMRDFPYPIVIWVTNQILSKLIKKASDFWSWRAGVFHFVSRKKNTVSSRELEPIHSVLIESELSGFDDENPYFLPIEDLRQFIYQKEQEGIKDSSLATLYFSLGNIYRRRLDKGEYQDYRKEQELAIECFSKAVEVQKELDLEKDLATSLNNLAALYKSQGRYSDAEPLYLQSLEIKKRQLGQDHPDVANSLNNLAALYEFQGRYSDAEPLYLQSLEILKRQLGQDHPDVATSLNNLASLYKSQGRYSDAEPLYLQSLEIRKRQLGQDHPNVATSLNNLAILYEAQNQYAEAENFSKQALVIYQKSLGEQHPDTQNAALTVKMLHIMKLLYCNKETLFDVLKSLAQQAEFPAFNTEVSLAMLEKLESNLDLLSDIREALQQQTEALDEDT
ncbi:tetratricopeptide repeat protein [Cylindrospermum stagnale PCC 7417]|uniref:Tetratricopeptide repeat protein n=1 Tax=Cylindrospermum stagnale PCC 7417 TaxID=56107 RepID=K9X2U0_9NOST|nr:tetratricopeptide repeat protein [Cylindrospermum stagnale]AFZ26376.1 tetratricopeptide repeat protein [Cylindrospermum stagnale PCC 7417]